jgi:hypothetical protein
MELDVAPVCQERMLEVETSLLDRRIIAPSGMPGA